MRHRSVKSPPTIADEVLTKANWNMNFKYRSSLESAHHYDEAAYEKLPMPMKPLLSGGLNARLKPIIQKPSAPDIESSKFFITTPLQCCLLVAPASTMMKPSCIKKISAEEARIQDELAPVYIAVSIDCWSAVNVIVEFYI